MRAGRKSNGLAAWLLVVCLLLPAPALAQIDPDVDETNYGAAVFDVVILRPLGLAAAVVGAALFVPAALITAPGGLDPVREAWELLVIVPGKNVFTRSLGDF